MKEQQWIFSVRYGEGLRDSCRRAVVGPARASTVEAAFHLANVPEAVRTEIRAHQVVRDFVDGRLDSERTGYYASRGSAASWVVCIGPVDEVLRSEDPR